MDAYCAAVDWGTTCFRLWVLGHDGRVPSASREIRILPGLAQRDPSCPDVMRGEETLLLRLVRTGVASGTVCLPGAHSKWVLLRDEIVSQFSTAMTGELFRCLRNSRRFAMPLQAMTGSMQIIHPLKAPSARGLRPCSPDKDCRGAAFLPDQRPKSGRAIISQRIARTPAKAGKPQANQMRYSRK